MQTSTFFKRFFLLLVLVLGAAIDTLQAQSQFGNEWINYSQTYHKIKVTNTGIHRLSFGYLDSLGVSTADPRNLQLFRRGKEVAILVAGQDDGRLDSQDYLEFYGERNDGAMDRELYKTAAHQQHQFYSLYTDTAAYFLTVAATPGKRMQLKNPVVAGKTPEPHHMQQSVFMYTDRYYTGKTYADNRMPWLDAGEGYASHSSRFPKTYTNSGANLMTNLVTSGPIPKLEYVAVTDNNITHDFVVNLVNGSTVIRQLGKFQVYGANFAKSNTKLDFSEITSTGQITLQVVPGNPDVEQDQVGFVYGKLFYPQKTIYPANQRQFLFYSDSTRAAAPYYELAGAPATAVAFDVTDPYNPIRIDGYAAGANKGYVVEGNNRTRKILVADINKPWKPVGRERNIRFRQITPAAHNYIIITNKRLMKVVNGEGLRAPQAYAAYRASQAGGGYDTLLVHMDQITDQFHYGEFSVNSIRRFMQFMQTSEAPKHLFIIGKGLKYGSPEYRSIYSNRFSYYHIGARHNKVHELDLVPTGIAPVSDVFFTADFKNGSYAPAVPTGRLSVTRPEEIISYLNKVKAHDGLQDGIAWRKNILQLGGGITQNEIRDHASYLSNYKKIAEGPLLGANVIEKYRQNVSQAIESINVVNEVNAGTTLITFFGHSSSSTTDLDIGYVSSPINGYNNKDKYPVILMNGCNSGDAFIPNNKSFGEDWVNTPDKGAIAFIAHAEAGYPNYLDTYSRNFYTTAFQDPQYYGKTLGQVQQQVIRRALQSANSELVHAMVMEMVLQGDPAIRMYAPAKPDYVALENKSDVVSAVEGEFLTASSDRFTIILGVDNLGKAITDSVSVSVKRTLADNSVIDHGPFKIGPVMRPGQVMLTIDNRNTQALGMNTFEVTLDSKQEVDELNENNNTARFQHFFPANGLMALTPSEYSIVASKNVKLIAQATQLDESRQGYVLEIDTTHTFKSNLKRSFAIGNAVLPTWDVDVSTLGNLPDSTVYYWRARFQNYSPGEDTLYAYSSFRVINGAGTGWSQSHIGQFKKATPNKLEVNETSPHFKFIPGVADVTIKTIGGDVRYNNSHGIFLNDRQLLNVPCDYPQSSTLSRLYMVVINDKTLEMVRGLNYATNCNGTEFNYLYQFRDMNNATVRANVETFLNQVPEGYYVAVISVNKVPFGSFTASQKAAFKSIGAGKIDGLVNSHPYALVGRKGAEPGSMYEVVASPDDPTVATSQEIVLRAVLRSNQPSGSITSSTIGPALNWGTLHHNIERYKAGNDDYTLKVIGVDKQEQEQVLIENVSSKALNLSTIDAGTYPYLKLQALLSDSTDRSAPQLKDWTVFYEAAPEGVIRPDLVEVSETIVTDQANKGKITVPMIFQNITQVAFKDSLVVDITVTGDGIQPVEKRLKLAPLAGNANANFSFEMPTNNLDGNYKLTMYVNPRVQPEQHYFNNIYTVNFKVKSRLHPTMDVAFDGVHILDGELVSPSPMISVTVKDENKYAYLEDASNIVIVLTDPEGTPREMRLEKGSEDVEHFEVFPATDKSDFRLEFRPKRMMEDGRYRMQVQAKDVAGKQAGVQPYRINFEVENKSTITNFYPFPNPFSTKTNFIFTLTGTTIPDHIKIQILTITGKVVKEIMKEELGPLRIGNNKTEYAWDGTDMYGDKLANGVYLYRVVISRSNEQMFHKQKFGDKAFKNGYGKIYILR